MHQEKGARHPQLFAVVSWGCAATRWLAKILNSHPEIFCVHALREYWPGTGREDLSYLQALASHGAGYHAAGDVHGLEAADIPWLRQVFGQVFQAVAVVRDPLPRLVSYLALFETQHTLQPFQRRLARQVSAMLGLDLPTGTYEEEVFVYAVTRLNLIVEEQEVGTLYRCEDLTTRPEVLGRCIADVTRGRVSPRDDWLQGAMQCAPTNAHRSAAPREPFTPWQVAVLQTCVLPQAWAAYADLGYPVPAWHTRS